MSFRDDVSPAEPSAFLRALVGSSADRARAVRDAVEDPEEDLETPLDSTEENAESASGDLSDATFGEFEVLSAAPDPTTPGSSTSPVGHSPGPTRTTRPPPPSGTSPTRHGRSGPPASSSRRSTSGPISSRSLGPSSR
jgi:hypothetical protein